MNRPLNEDASIPTREEIAARLASGRRRKVLVGWYDEVEARARAVGNKAIEVDASVMALLYAHAQHPYFNAGPADVARWRRLNGAEECWCAVARVER